MSRRDDGRATADDLIARFRGVNASGYPEVHSLPRVLNQALWVLAVAKDELGVDQMNSPDIARVLCKACEVSVTRQAVEAGLKNAGDLVHREKKGGSVSYTIMKKGRDALEGAAGSHVLLIEPESALKGIRAVEDLMGGLAGDVSICDPYVDPKTVDYLDLIPAGTPVRLLTQTVQRERPLVRDLEAARKQGLDVEVRVVPSAQLHDRYIIAGKVMYLFGQSLNGIGKKQTFVVRLGEDTRSAVLKLFDHRWASAKVLS